MMVPCVFLSSTFSDFNRERSILQEVIPYVDVHVNCAERKGFEGSSLNDTLEKWIYKSDMIILLIGMSYGTESKEGLSWTETEIRYAIKNKKRIFAYFRDLKPEQLRLIDSNEEKRKKLDVFIKMLEKHVPIIPRYKYGEYCKFVAMVIRDIDRYAEKLKENERQENYNGSFD